MRGSHRLGTEPASWQSQGRQPGKPWKPGAQASQRRPVTLGLHLTEGVQRLAASPPPDLSCCTETAGGPRGGGPQGVPLPHPRLESALSGNAARPRTTPGPRGQPRCPAHLHWPLSTSQVGSASSWTPGPEQSHSSQPTRGWQPKVCGWQTTQSGGTVRGGQTHRPVSSSHRRPRHSQAVGSVHEGDERLCPIRGPGCSRGTPPPPPWHGVTQLQAPSLRQLLCGASVAQNCRLVPGTCVTPCMAQAPRCPRSWTQGPAGWVCQALELPPGHGSHACFY